MSDQRIQSYDESDGSKLSRKIKESPFMVAGKIVRYKRKRSIQLISLKNYQQFLFSFRSDGIGSGLRDRSLQIQEQR